MRTALIVVLFTFATITSAQARPDSWNHIDCNKLDQVEAPSWLPSQAGTATYKLPGSARELKEVRGTPELIAAVQAADQRLKSKGYTLAGYNMTQSWSELLKDFCEQKTNHSGAALEEYLTYSSVQGSLQGCAIHLSIRSKKGQKMDSIDLNADSVPSNVVKWWKMSYDFYTNAGFVNLDTSRDNPNWENTEYFVWFYQCARPIARNSDYQ